MHQLINYFVDDLEAQSMACLTNLNRHMINRYLSLIRQRIAVLCEQESLFRGKIEVDESYLGGKRIKDIESFWSYAKRRLMKFHGLADSIF